MNPISLLKLEWRRFSPNGTFRVIAILYVVFFSLLWILAHLIGSNMTFSSNGHAFNPTADLFVYPKSWELLAYIGSWVNAALLGFLGVFMITLEFNYKTLRQSVIFGLSRPDLFVSKAGSAVAIAVAATLCYLILGCFGSSGAAMELVAGPGFAPLKCAGEFFLQSLGYLLLGTLFGLLIRQTALATLAYLGYVFFLEGVASWIFFYVVSKTRLLLFLPNAVLAKLTPFPVPQSISDAMGPNALFVPLSGLEIVTASVIYLLLFAFFLRRRLLRSDL